jgi:hypothetical protein
MSPLPSHQNDGNQDMHDYGMHLQRDQIMINEDGFIQEEDVLENYNYKRANQGKTLSRNMGSGNIEQGLLDLHMLQR